MIDRHRNVSLGNTWYVLQPSSKNLNGFTLSRHEESKFECDQEGLSNVPNEIQGQLVSLCQFNLALPDLLFILFVIFFCHEPFRITGIHGTIVYFPDP